MMNRSRKGILFFVIIAVSIAATFSFADGPTDGKDRGGKWTEKEFKKLDKRFDFTPEQEDRVKTILIEKNEKMRILRQDMRKQMDTFCQEADGKIKGLLTGSQKAAYEKSSEKGGCCPDASHQCFMK